MVSCFDDLQLVKTTFSFTRNEGVVNVYQLLGKAIFGIINTLGRSLSNNLMTSCIDAGMVSSICILMHLEGRSFMSPMVWTGLSHESDGLDRVVTEPLLWLWHYMRKRLIVTGDIVVFFRWCCHYICAMCFRLLILSSLISNSSLCTSLSQAIVSAKILWNSISDYFLMPWILNNKIKMAVSIAAI